MRKISGQLLSSKPVTLSRAAKLISRFADADNGSSATVSLYLQRTADAFNNLVQFHSKRLKTGDVESSPYRKRAPQSPDRNPDGKAAQDSNGGEKTGGETVDDVGDANPNSVELQNLTGEEKKQKKKKKRKSDSAVDESKERSSNKPEANSIGDEGQNANSVGDEGQNVQKEEKKKKKKKRKSGAVDSKEE